MIKIRNAELEIKKIEHHIVRVRTATVTNRETLRRLKSEMHNDLKSADDLSRARQLQQTIWLYVIASRKAFLDLPCCRKRPAKLQTKPSGKKYHGQTLDELQQSRKPKAPVSQLDDGELFHNPVQATLTHSDKHHNKRASLESPSPFIRLSTEFGERQSNPMHSEVDEQWGMFPAGKEVEDQSNSLYSRPMPKSTNPMGASSKSLQDEQGSWDIFPDGELRLSNPLGKKHISQTQGRSSKWGLLKKSGSLKRIISNETNPLHAMSNNPLAKNRASTISTSAQRAIDEAKKQAAAALERANVAETKRFEAEKANSEMEKQLRSRSDSTVEARIEARVKTSAAKALHDQERLASMTRKHAEELEKRTQDAEQRAKAAEQRAKQVQQQSDKSKKEIKKLMSFRGDVASKAQLFAKRRSTRLERVCKHKDQCGCSGFVTDIKAAGFVCICGHSNVDHIHIGHATSIRDLQTLDESRKETRDRLL
jgi:hypothetical protein